MEISVRHKYQRFLELERKLKPKSFKAYLKNLDLVTSKAGDLFLVKHRDEIVEAILAVEREQGWNPSGASSWRCSHNICYFYKWATMDGLIPFNPYPFNAFRKPQYKSVQFTNNEEWEILSSNEIHLTHQDKLMLWTFWDTGLRREELAKLDQDDFILPERIIFLPEDKSKGGYGQRYVAMSRKTFALATRQFKLLKSLNIGPHAFVGEGYGRINVDEVTARITKIGRVVKPGNFIKINPRKLRHSVPIRMLEAGAGDLEVMTTMGHASNEMTRRYTHSTKTFARSVRDKYLQKA